MNYIQGLLDNLKQENIDSQWANSRNEWIKILPPVTKGKIGEKIALRLLDAKQAIDNKQGYDVYTTDMRVEVKLACSGTMGGYSAIMWRQIRPNDPYTHIFFIAVYPHKIRAFLVPKDSIPSSALLHQHGRGKTLDIYCITTRKVDRLFDWMIKYELNNRSAFTINKV
jgi:hypothetical protein